MAWAAAFVGDEGVGDGGEDVRVLVSAVLLLGIDSDNRSWLVFVQSSFKWSSSFSSSMTSSSSPSISSWDWFRSVMAIAYVI